MELTEVADARQVSLATLEGRFKRASDDWSTLRASPAKWPKSARFPGKKGHSAG